MRINKYTYKRLAKKHIFQVRMSPFDRQQLMGRVADVKTFDDFLSFVGDASFAEQRAKGRPQLSESFLNTLPQKLVGE